MAHGQSKMLEIMSKALICVQQEHWATINIAVQSNISDFAVGPGGVMQK